MPTSLHSHISKMVDWIVKIQPTSVLDIGSGFGKWGFLAREYTDIFANRYEPSDWTTRIDGVEAFPQYLSPIHKFVYTNIYEGDVRNILPQLPSYDLVIIGDVIEHFTKEEGLSLLKQLLEKSAFVLLSSPTVFFEQSICDNSFEDHKSFWSVEDFTPWNFDYEEFDLVFVALLKGRLSSKAPIQLDGRECSAVYKQQWLKKRPKIAHFLKGRLKRAIG